jgi:gluconolactonase
LYVSVGDDAVAKIAPDGTQIRWTTAQSPNGHKILPDGTHLLCVAGAVLHLAANGKQLAQVASSWNGKPLLGPNDITLDGKGGFYFSDPAGSRENPVGAVYFVDRVASDAKVRMVAGGMWVPNGLVLSPDGKKLYVAETVPNRILWFAVRPDGGLGPLNVFATLPQTDKTDGPDGLAVDTQGNLYVAHLGMTAVQVLAPSGVLLRSLPAGAYDASNLAWGGPRADQLFITGAIGHRKNTAGRVFRLDVKGARGVTPLLAPTK